MAKDKNKFEAHVSIKNKRASREFVFLDKFVAGIMLLGTEIKSIREGKVNLQDGYCLFHANELFIRNMHISHYKQAAYNNHEPLRERKLLLSKNELAKLKRKIEEKGLTLVPTRLFTNARGLAKLEIALSKGKKLYDKRENIKRKDIDRERRNLEA